MKTAASLRGMALACAFAWTPFATGAGFVNLDFEQATVPAGELFLSWEQAAPGWSHSAGDSTDHVNYLVEHLGYSQNYVLLDAAYSPFGAATGSYAMAMKSGTFFEHEPRGEWTQAYVAQTGLVPVGARTLSLLASSHRVLVSLGGVGLSLIPVGLDPSSPTYGSDLLTYSGEWQADISSFAGQTLELRIADGSSPSSSFGPVLVVFDQIRILAIPEPATLWLLGIGMGLLAVQVRHTRKTSRADAPMR